MTPKAKARCRPALTTFLALSPAARSAFSLADLAFNRCKHLAWCGGASAVASASEFHPKVPDAAFEVDPHGFDVCLGGTVARDYHCLPPPGVSNEGSIPSSSRAVKKDSAMRARETAVSVVSDEHPSCTRKRRTLKQITTILRNLSGKPARPASNLQQGEPLKTRDPIDPNRRTLHRWASHCQSPSQSPAATPRLPLRPTCLGAASASRRGKHPPAKRPKL